jgi:cold shock CspA family protein
MTKFLRCAGRGVWCADATPPTAVGPADPGDSEMVQPGEGLRVRPLLDGGRAEVFVHAAALQRSGIAKLAEGQRVAMEVTEGRKGLEAVAVSITR